MIGNGAYLPCVKGDKVCRCDGVVVENPYILVDGDVFLRFGEGSEVMVKYEALKKVHIQMLGKDSVKSLAAINLTGIAPELAVYIIRRSLVYTASGFVNSVRQKHNDDDFSAWLRDEMETFKVE